MKEIINDIDKLDGMVKIKGKCGYEIIGGCFDLRRLKQENKKLKEALEKIKTKCEKDISFCEECNSDQPEIDCYDCAEGGRAVLAKEIIEVLKDE